MKLKRPLFILNKRRYLIETREVFAEERGGLSNILLEMISEGEAETEIVNR